MVHRGLVAPSSRWSLRSPASISRAGDSHFSRPSLSELLLDATNHRFRRTKWNSFFEVPKTKGDDNQMASIHKWFVS